MSTTEARPRAILIDTLPHPLVRDVLAVGLYVVAIAVSAQLVIPLPFTPVPITGQTFVVLAGALCLGASRSVIGTSLYLGVGLAGMPWFTPASSATLGYVIGFILAGWAVGFLAQRGAGRTLTSGIAAMVLGNVLIYAVGAPYLKLATGMSWSAALAAGVTPFLIGDAIKILFAAGLTRGRWQMSGGPFVKASSRDAGGA